MKKIFTLSLILVLAAPLTGFICDCYPMNPASPLESSIQSPSCDCCPAMNLKRDQGPILKIGNLVPVLLYLQLPQVSAEGKTLTRPAISDLALTNQALGPPLFSSPTPLRI